MILKTKYFLFFCIFNSLFFSCQHKATTKDNTIENIQSPENQVFNQEIYQQKITVNILNEGNVKKMSFDGALKKRYSQMSLYAFGPFGTTLFTLKDSKGQIEYVANIKELKDKSEFILKLYPAIKKIFLLKTTDTEFLNKKFKIQLEEPLAAVNVALSKVNFKNNDLVDLISVQKENYFEFVIENVNEDTGHH